MALSQLDLRTSYHKGEDDLAEDFYLPCMSSSVSYDRAVGFFRSSIFILAWPALIQFVKAGGRMRILCSQILSEADAAALDEGYAARVDASIAERLENEVSSLISDETLRVPTLVLSSLVAAGIIDLKIAVIRRSDLSHSDNRIFHDKLGIFKDSDGATVIFKGSMNETWMGLAADGNIESIDVAASWMGQRDRQRCTAEQRYFEDLWSDSYPGLSVRPFPEAAKNRLVREASSDWEESLETALIEEKTTRLDHRGRTLKPHQSAGLASWEANERRGILAFATGSGKTFTALAAIREAISKHQEVVLVVVPDTALFDQWNLELRGGLEDLGVSMLKAGHGNARWRDSLALWTAPGGGPRLVLATAQTASTTDFLGRITGGSHLMLVADEVHRLGAPVRQSILREDLFGPRLGLSATPERAGDLEGTEKLLSFFRGVLEPRYSLSDAVRDGVLCRYFYRPHVVLLDGDEMQSWRDLSAQIGQLWARSGGDSTSKQVSDRLKMLLIRRAKIVKHAAGKITLAAEVLKKEYEPGQRWIVYCDDVNQLEEVMGVIREQGLAPMPYHSRMDADRGETIRWLERRGGIVVSIKCLDEGVDIPSVTHALILASSKNPREFIQRRGRVLRTAPDKTLAFLHDAIVIPQRDAANTDKEPDPITAGEIGRALEFAEHAENPSSGSDLKKAAVAAGVNWHDLVSEGIEDDEVQ